jgi:hypothetical protein
MAKQLAVAILLCFASATTADAVDLKKFLKQLVPCKSAALRLCDRSQGMTTSALWKCGATLAARQQEVGQRCVEVLRRYGQL